LTLWFVAAAVLVAANSYVCYVNVGRLIGSDARVTRSRQMIMATDAVVASLVDAETGERGYLITGAPDYLRPYRETKGRIDAQLADLAKLVSDDDPVEARQVADVTRLAGLKIA